MTGQFVLPHVKIIERSLGSIKPSRGGEGLGLDPGPTFEGVEESARSLQLRGDAKVCDLRLPLSVHQNVGVPVDIRNHKFKRDVLSTG